MDVWERTVRKLEVARSSITIEILNAPRGFAHANLRVELEIVERKLAIARFLRKLYSKQSESIVRPRPGMSNMTDVA